MKTCPTCLQVKELGEFGINKSKSDGRQSQCRNCKKIVDAKHYQENKDRQHKRNRDFSARNRDAIQALKSVPCMDCGKSYPPYVMDFDHVRGVKARDISNMYKNSSLANILEEVAKCDIVCSNCHRIRTFTRI